MTENNDKTREQTFREYVNESKNKNTCTVENELMLLEGMSEEGFTE